MSTEIRPVKKQSLPQYYIWADVIRLVAISLVAMVHSSSIDARPTLDSRASLFLFIVAKTGVPLFVMLSGALLLAKKESIEVFVHKRLKRILVPWILATLLFVFVGRSMTGLSLIQIWNIFQITLTAQFTYIPMIFCLYLLIPIFRKFIQNSDLKMCIYITGLWFLGVSVLPHVRNTLAFPLSVDTGLVRQTIDFSGY